MTASSARPPRRTPLYDLHVELGATMVDFAGWSKIKPDESLGRLADWYGRVSARPSAQA